MRTLEARFHPPPASKETFFVVAHIIWDGSPAELRPRVVPVPSLVNARAPATLLATLRHLVLKTGPTSFDRLKALRSRYWSFVAVVQDA